MPKYAKFLKGLLSNKTRLEEACTVTMNGRCSAVLLNKIPSKEKDPGSFTIPCDIGNLHIDNDLADLGASISLMPNTMYEKLDMREDSRIPIILGRPFLATARAMIDVFNKKITLRVGDDEVTFDIDQSIKRVPAEDDECYGIDDLDETIHLEAQELLEDDQMDSFLVSNLEKCIVQSNPKSRDDSEEPIRRFFQIPIAPEDQEKMAFTRPYGTFAYTRMPFGLCNAPTTFQRCTTAIFHDMVEDFMEVLLLQWFNIKIKDKKGGENLAVDHLLRLENPTMGELAKQEIANKFPGENLMILKSKLNDEEPWYADYVNYIVGKVIPPKWTPERKKMVLLSSEELFLGLTIRI
ncbi:hypothetical protein Tco_1152891 [Tanacetum coccineum]